MDADADMRLAALIGFLLIIGIAVVASIVTYEVKKGPPKKPNIRVPRETLWGRTNRFHNTDTH